jgi:hypothetical protein
MIHSQPSAYFAYPSWPPSVPSYFSPNDIVRSMLRNLNFFLLITTRLALVLPTFIVVIFVAGRGVFDLLLLLLQFCFIY